MAGSAKRVAWDACSWIAMIQREKIRDEKGKVIEDRYPLCRSVIDAAEKGNVEIVTSGLCLVEVNKPSADTSRAQIAAYFENDYIVIVPLDRIVGVEARKLMAAGHAGLKPPDASHLATALVANADELHTFDDRLLALDEKLAKQDGTMLRICKPGLGSVELPLLKPLEAVGAKPNPPTAEPKAAKPVRLLDLAEEKPKTKPKAKAPAPKTEPQKKSNETKAEKP